MCADTSQQNARISDVWIAGGAVLPKRSAQLLLELFVGCVPLGEKNPSIFADDDDPRQLDNFVIVDDVGISSDEHLIGELVVFRISLNPTRHIDRVDGEDDKFLVFVEDLLERRKLRLALPSFRFPEMYNHGALVLELAERHGFATHGRELEIGSFHSGAQSLLREENGSNKDERQEKGDALSTQCVRHSVGVWSCALASGRLLANRGLRFAPIYEAPD